MGSVATVRMDNSNRADLGGSDNDSGHLDLCFEIGLWSTCHPACKFSSGTLESTELWITTKALFDEQGWPYKTKTEEFEYEVNYT